jgi:tetratricopeptide (TPR) repeat protein
VALAADRRERFGDLTQLYDAVEGVQKRLPVEQEKQLFNGIRARAARAGMDKEALAKVIEKVTQLESQLALSGKALSRLDVAQRQALERLDRFESGLERLEKARQRPSIALPVLTMGLLGAAIGAAAVVFVPSPLRLERSEQGSPPLATAGPAPPVVPAAPADAGVLREEKTIDAGALAAAIDASVPDASVAMAADAGPVQVAEAASPPAKPPPASPPVRRRNQEATRAEMVHAVALSQVKRGESALERNRVEEAVESFKAAIDNEPGIASAWRGLGMAYAMRGKDALALQSYQRYLQLAPRAPDAAEIRASIAELRLRSRKIGGSEEK